MNYYYQFLNVPNRLFSDEKNLNCHIYIIIMFLST